MQSAGAGAAQVALVGAPNAGKSLLHDRLTGSGAKSGPYPFTTQHPEPGMLKWEDVHFQLVDLPAIAVEHPLPWLTNTLQTADACLLVVDLADPECLQHVAAVQEELVRRKATLVTRWPAEGAVAGTSESAVAEDDIFALRLPTLLLANKADLLDHADTDLEVLAELEEPHFPALLVSAQGGLGLGDLTISGASLVWASGNSQDISDRTVTFGASPVTFDTNGNDVVLANSIGNSISGWASGT